MADPTPKSEVHNHGRTKIAMLSLVDCDKLETIKAPYGAFMVQ
jgi:hypothetical protein